MHRVLKVALLTVLLSAALVPAPPQAVADTGLNTCCYESISTGISPSVAYPRDWITQSITFVLGGSFNFNCGWTTASVYDMTTGERVWVGGPVRICRGQSYTFWAGYSASSRPLNTTHVMRGFIWSRNCACYPGPGPTGTPTVGGTNDGFADASLRIVAIGSPDKPRGGRPGGNAGDTQPPWISSAYLFRLPTARPFILSLRATIDDTARGNSPISKVIWSWRGKQVHILPVRQPSTKLLNALFEIPVFEVQPLVRTQLLLQAVDAAGNTSSPFTIDYQLPGAPVYVAIGDSFASGHRGKTNTYDKSYGYPAHFAKRLPSGGSRSGWKYSYINVAKSGATTNEILADQIPKARRTLSNRQGSWNVVTVSAGANDTGFVSALFTQKAVEGTQCPRHIAVPTSIRGQVKRILDEVRAADINAAIFVTGYPNPYPSSSPCFAATDTFLQNPNSGLNTQVRSASSDAVRAYYVDYYESFARQRADARGRHPWILQNVFGFPHPNTFGHQLIANLVSNARSRAWL